MASERKRYYWLKLSDDFFKQKEIKKLRSIAGGDTFTIIYLKMLLRSMQDGGKLYYECIEDNFVSELALDIDEDEDNVGVTVRFLIAKGILHQNTASEYEVMTASEMTGSECESARRVRKMRAAMMLEEGPKPQVKAKTNAERQKSFRAKQTCESKHIPLIEDHVNAKRYSGNYYLVFQRDRYQCAICNSTENLCVHHIDGYCEDKPENNAINKMIVLCRSCHSRVHSSELEIPMDLLDSIGYETDSNSDRNVTYGVTCNGAVTTCNTEKEKEIEIEREYNRRDKRATFSPPSVEDVQEYAKEKGYSEREFDPESFVNFYGSKGWVVGKSKMKDWRKAASGWVARYRKEHGIQKEQPIVRDLTVDEIMRRSMGL